MKRFLLAFLLTALLTVATSAYANDIDGLWVSDGPLTKNSSWFMMREHENSILVININLTTDTYIAWLGPYVKTISLARLNQLNHQTIVQDNEPTTLPEESQVTLTFTSPTTVIIELAQCRDFPGQNNCSPIGTAITASKFY